MNPFFLFSNPPMVYAIRICITTLIIFQGAITVPVILKGMQGYMMHLLFIGTMKIQKIKYTLLPREQGKLCLS